MTPLCGLKEVVCFQWDGGSQSKTETAGTQSDALTCHVCWRAQRESFLFLAAYVKNIWKLIILISGLRRDYEGKKYWHFYKYCMQACYLPLAGKGALWYPQDTCFLASCAAYLATSAPRSYMQARQNKKKLTLSEQQASNESAETYSFLVFANNTTNPFLSCIYKHWRWLARSTANLSRFLKVLRCCVCTKCWAAVSRQG